MQRGFSTIFIILGIIVVLALAGGAYYLGQANTKSTVSQVNNYPTNTPQASNSPTATTSETPRPLAPTTNLKTYNSTEYKFTLKYSPNLQEQTTTSADKIPYLLIRFEQPSPELGRGPDTKILLSVYPENIENAAYLVQQRQDAKEMLTLKQGEKRQVIGTVFTRVNNIVQNGLTFTIYEGSAVPNYPSEVANFEKRAILKNGETIYVFTVSSFTKETYDKFLVYFDQILSTFKFAP